MVEEASLTPQQFKTLEVIRKYVRKHRIPPTQAEIAKTLRIHRFGVNRHLEALARKDYLTLSRNSARGIVLRHSPWAVPLYSRCAAGQPLECPENIEQMIEVPPGLFKREADFFIQIFGDSMVNKGINHGDWIAVKRTESAAPGQLVVFRIKQKTLDSADEGLDSQLDQLLEDSKEGYTLKEMRVEKGVLVLVPHSSNPDHKPIRVPPDRVEICGLYSGLIRPE